MTEIAAEKHQLEMELLLCCARTEIDRQCRDRIQHIAQQNIDWDYLLKLTAWHQVTPLLFWQLQNTRAEIIPQKVLEELRSASKANAKRNFGLTGELLNLLRLFDKNAIPIMPFKGPALAEVAYKNSTLREFLDLDILIPAEFVPQARKLLISQGYEPQFDLADTQELIYTKLRHEHMFWHEGKQIALDVHWSLFPLNFSFSDDQNLTWKHQTKIQLSGKSVETLSAESLLLFLCFHGCKHNWSRLKSICDLAELIRSQPEIDWNWILSEAQRLGIERMLLLGLYLCQHLLDTPLPDLLDRQVESNLPIKSLASEVERLLFIVPERADSLPKNNIYLKTMESGKDKIWYYFNLIFTPTPLEWQIIPLPKWLFPLYYLIRPIRLTIKHSLGHEL
ncbi:MAG: nucleotidyltransferase family protein [Cyanosarcina radialis HA8281-LM2]|jgi:hypothetical protein|nr:nucleotidyltransferase family protein [Cyanosarcina radialis HA8281-LM2]